MKQILHNFLNCVNLKNFNYLLKYLLFFQDFHLILILPDITKVFRSIQKVKMLLYSRKELIFEKVKIEAEQGSMPFKVFSIFWKRFLIFLYFQFFLIYLLVILQVISPYSLTHFFLFINYQFHLIFLLVELNLNSNFNSNFFIFLKTQFIKVTLS